MGDDTAHGGGFARPITDEANGEREAEVIDDWWHHAGHFAFDDPRRAQWAAEVGRVEITLAEFDPVGDVLEIGAGTGIWSLQLARTARELTVIDRSEKMVAINRQRVAPVCAERGCAYRSFVVPDVLSGAWKPIHRYDVVMLGFFLASLPMSRFDWFWQDFLRRALTPLGRVFFVERTPTAIASMAANRPDSGRNGAGRFEPDVLRHALRLVGFRADVRATGQFFVYGSATPAPTD